MTGIRRSSIFILFLTILFMITAAWGAEKDFLSSGADSGQEPWDIEAQELTYNKETDTYTAKGEVVIKKGERVLQCDWATVNRKTMIARAVGNIRFSSAGDQLQGEEMTVDLDKQTGEIKKGRLFLKQNHFYVTGEEIHKTGESTYRVVNGTFTSCEGEKVPWEIRAKELTVTVEGYGQVWHSSFRVKDLPVLYFPYMVFPAKTKRQSGLLIPEPGYSTRDGALLNLPVYFVLSDQTDLTFYEQVMSRRGFMQGTEFRYVLSPQSKGTLLFDYLFKDLLGREEYEKGHIAEPYERRYWFRGKINQRLPFQTDLKLDLDWVSDRDYLKEFRGLSNNLNDNRAYFLKEFSRDVDGETVLTRKNAAVFTKGLGPYQFTGGFIYYREVDGTEDSLHQLPFLRFDSVKQALWKNLYLQWYSSYNHYWRKEGEQGQVLDLDPTLSLPLRWKNYLKMEGSLGVTETLFQVKEKESDAVKDTGSRTVPRVRLDLSTDIQRVFQVSGKELQKVKHTIRPQIIYNYVPEVQQEGLPSFVSALNKQNTLTYYLTNTFTGKFVIGKGKNGEDLFSYRDLAQIRFYQTYDINEAGRETAPGESRRPFSNLYGEVEFRPLSRLTWRSTLSWSPYEKEMASQSHYLSYWDKKGSSAYVEYFSGAGNTYRQINANLLWKIHPAWSADFLTRYSLDQKQNYETKVGLSYTHQCYGIRAYYATTLDDRKFIVSVSLKGLGELF
jgi:LPS-assembly protein